ncbi:MAG TPA: hypothetical protein VN203_19040, partial [Candidatus Acidoferrum sp.]|nr:hypothetical protein [Candidatus Acidoferrum sp.]
EEQILAVFGPPQSHNGRMLNQNQGVRNAPQNALTDQALLPSQCDRIRLKAQVQYFPWPLYRGRADLSPRRICYNTHPISH